MKYKALAKHNVFSVFAELRFTNTKKKKFYPVSKKTIYTIVAFSVVITSCSKYDEGPSLSLRSKKARIAGEWKIESVSENGTDITSDYTAVFGSDATFHIEKSGTYHIHYTGGEDEGTWAFKGGKDEITFISNETGAGAEDYHILKLKNNELWLEHHHDDETLEFHYKQ
ncbi:MAG TPA: lipocalin family protein [Flavobacteriales bacterium]|nr:lipocalin family protein [Flavobacteriales bacterium]